MQALRTPDERFAEVSEFPYAPKYYEIADGDGGHLRVAWGEDRRSAHAPPRRLFGSFER
jgi:haloalkane dehalogenase